MDNSQLSDNFLFWCERLAHFDNYSWKRAFDGISKLIDKAIDAGEEIWPPSYIEFIKMGNPPKIAPDGRNSSAYLDWDDPRRPENDPNHPNYVPPQRVLIEDLTAKAERKAKGHAAALKILGTFE